MTKIYFEKTDDCSYKAMSYRAYDLLRRKLAEYLSVSLCEILIKKDDKGKPFIVGREDIFVSISHSCGMVMCAFSDKEIGVDIELVRERRKSVEKRVFTDAESFLIDGSSDENTAFFTLWTLKESYLKAIGTGFANNAKEIEFITIENPVISNNKNFDFKCGIKSTFVFSVCEKNN